MHTILKLLSPNISCSSFFSFSFIVSTTTGGVILCLLDKNISIASKNFHFFVTPFPVFRDLSFSCLYFCRSFLILLVTSLRVKPSYPFSFNWSCLLEKYYYGWRQIRLCYGHMVYAQQLKVNINQCINMIVVSYTYQQYLIYFCNILRSFRRI